IKKNMRLQREVEKLKDQQSAASSQAKATQTTLDEKDKEFDVYIKDHKALDAAWTQARERLNALMDRLKKIHAPLIANIENEYIAPYQSELDKLREEYQTLTKPRDGDLAKAETKEKEEEEKALAKADVYDRLKKVRERVKANVAEKEKAWKAAD